MRIQRRPELRKGKLKMRKQKVKKQKELRLCLGVAVSFFVTSIGLGILIGRFTSPNWENSILVDKYIDRHHDAWFLTKGRPESDPIAVRFRLDDKYLVYKTDTGKIEEEAVPAAELQKPSWRSKEKLDQIKEGLALGGVPVATALTKWHIPLGNRTVAVTIAGGVVLLSGVILGYCMSHSEEPDFNSKPFKELGSNKARWHQLAEDWRSKQLHELQAGAVPSAAPY